MNKRIFYTNSLTGVLEMIIPVSGGRGLVTVVPASTRVVDDVVMKPGRTKKHKTKKTVIKREEYVPPVLREETDEEFLARLIARHVPPGADFQVVDVADIPARRSFRRAWKLRGNKVAVDMPEARDIKRQEIRVLRAKDLASLDIDWQRADENQDEAARARVIARKQSLRDITKHSSIEKAKTPEQLEKIDYQTLAESA